MCRVTIGRPFIRVPHFYRRIDVADAALVAPLDDLAAVDVPGQVDDDVAFADVLCQFVPEIVPA